MSGTVAELRADGVIVGIATSKPTPIAQRVLDALGWSSAFDVVDRRESRPQPTHEGGRDRVGARAPRRCRRRPPRGSRGDGRGPPPRCRRRPCARIDVCGRGVGIRQPGRTRRGRRRPDGGLGRIAAKRTRSCLRSRRQGGPVTVPAAATGRPSGRRRVHVGTVMTAAAHPDQALARHAVVIAGARIEAIVPVQRLSEFETGSLKVHDHGSALISPGFVDAHVHLGQVGLAQRSLDLNETRSLDDVLDGFAIGPPTNPMVSSSAWGGTTRAGRVGARAPSAADLDAAAPGRLVYLARVDVHSAVVSSALARVSHDAAGRPAASLDGWARHRCRRTRRPPRRARRRQRSAKPGRTTRRPGLGVDHRRGPRARRGARTRGPPSERP